MADATADLQLADFFAVGMQHVAVAMHGMFAPNHGCCASVRWCLQVHIVLQMWHKNDCLRHDSGCNSFGYSCRIQEIDMFGEISGVCFSPQADKFFVGIADATYSSLLQFNCHEHQSLQQHGSL